MQIIWKKVGRVSPNRIHPTNEETPFLLSDFADKGVYSFDEMGC